VKRQWDERRGMDAKERLIAETAEANRALGASGQSDMVWGHASVRDPDGRGVWMKAAGWSFGEVTPARVALVTPAGEVLAGNGPRHIEYPIHTEVMLARPDVASVVHTHAPAAVSFGALDVPLLAISHDGVEFAEPQIARFTRTGSLVNSAELGRELAAAIGDGVGCLIPQHGLVTVGPDAATAVMRAVLLARACHVQLQAMAAGEIRLWSDSAEIALKKAQVWPQSQIDAGYAFLRRQSG
jgi:ribulose-5-phosphate 4-epimerase/fuculose-1-phosphate aldolase